MKLTNISYRNIKGHTGSHDIGPAVVITGPAASGKTAITDALRISLFGCHPNLGERVGDTFRLASGMVMSASVKFDTGMTYAHNWTMERGSVKHTGPDPVPNLPRVMFDALEFLSMTAKERTAMLFEQVCNGADFDASDLISKVKMLRPDGYDADMETVIAECVDDIETMDQERLETQQALPAWMASVIQRFKEKQSEADAVVKQMRNAIKAGAQNLASGGMPVMRPGIDSEIVALRKQLEAIVTDAAQKTAQLSTENNNRQALSLARESLKTTRDCSTELDATKLEEARCAALVKDKKEQGWEFNKTLLKVQHDLDTYKMDRDAKATEVLRIKTELDAATMGDCCPECGAKNKKWKTRRIEKYQPQLDAAIAAQNTALKDLDFAQKQFDELSAKAGDIEKADAKLRADGQAYTAAMQRVNELQSMQRNFDKASQAVKSIIILDDAAYTALKADIERLTAAQAAHRVTIREMEQQQRLALAAKAQAAEREKTAQALAEQERIAKVAREVGKILVEAQDEAIAKSVGGFMAKAGALLQEVMGVKLEFRDGEIGYWSGPQWVGYKTFSQTEEVLSFAGFALALAKDSPIKIVVIDELGRIDLVRKDKLIHTMLGMIARGEIDNFIGIDPDGKYSLEGLQVINCGA